MKTKVLFIVILLSLLQGCAFLDFFKRHDPPPPPPDKVVNLDPRSLESCRQLPTLAANTPEAILDNVKELVVTYYDCYTRQENSIKLLKGFANKKD